MTEFVDTPGGARIAVDRAGEGPAIIQVDGAFQHRAIDQGGEELAGAFAQRGYQYLRYDRPGRGETEASGPYTLADNIDAVRALIDFAGDTAILLGVSSGGSISLAAAAAGAEVHRLILWESPVGEELSTQAAQELMEFRQKLAAGDDDASVRYFMKDFPPEWVEASANSPMWPVMTGLAGSLEADTESIAWTQSAPRKELFAGITAPTLILVGDPTLPIFPAAAESLAATLPDATMDVIASGAPHQPKHDALVERIAAFLTA